MEHRTTTNWRDLLPVHPAAELFPPMSAEELKELADDIEKNGLRIPIELYRDTDGKVSLLDGRNRLDALALLGCQFVLPPHPDELPFDVILPNGLPLDEETEVWCVIAYADRADPYDLAIALNIKRRHLNREQKRELIAKVLAMQPDRSSRAIAAEVGVSHPTVEKIRREQVENFTTSAEPKVLNMIGAIEYNVTTKKVPLEVPVAVKNEPKTPTMIGAVDFKSTVKNVALEVPARATAVDADTGKEIEVESIPPNLVELRRGRDGKSSR